ncbi:cupin domain-containing protein [Bradyrhizobium sp. 5.13L]
MKDPARLIEVKDQPFCIKWNERDVNWRDVSGPFSGASLPYSDKPGWYGTSTGATIVGANFKFLSYYLPFGQARPFHISTPLELLVFVIEGEMEWGVGPNPDNLQYFQLAKHDTLLVPRGMGVDYRNTGQGEARYVMTIGRVQEWPAESIYIMPGEEPVHVKR